MEARIQRMRAAVLAAGRSLFKLRPFEDVLLRATRGRPFQGLRSKLPPAHTSYRPGTTRTVVRFGCTMDLELSDLVDWWAFWGFTDPVHDLYGSRCEPGATVIDVGANRGLTTIRVARAVGPTGRVIAIEADPRNVEVLATRVAVNRLTWVRVVQAAAAEAPGLLQIDVRDDRNSGMNSIAEKGVNVGAVTVDDLVSELDLASVDVVKIDVEGYEERVLAGAAKTIERHRPDVIAEVNDENLARFGASRNELYGRLPGYSITDAASPGDELTAPYGDVLAVAR